VRRSAVPERFFARQSSLHKDGYTFMQSSSITAEQVQSEKSISEQVATAVRVRYPQLHRRVELVYLLTIGELLVFVVPYILIIIFLFMQSWLYAIVMMAIILINSYFYAKIVSKTYGKSLPRTYILMPLAILYDVSLLNYSMWLYEFKEVVWKGRNVCVPVMHAYVSLPNISDKP
jgi:hypothetical protein